MPSLKKYAVLCLLIISLTACFEDVKKKQREFNNQIVTHLNITNAELNKITSTFNREVNALATKPEAQKKEAFKKIQNEMALQIQTYKKTLDDKLAAIKQLQIPKDGDAIHRQTVDYLVKTQKLIHDDFMGFINLDFANMSEETLNEKSQTFTKRVNELEANLNDLKKALSDFHSKAKEK